MIDIKRILANPELFDADMIRRGHPIRAAELIELRKKHAGQQQAIQEMQSLINVLSKEVGEKKRAGQPTEDLIARVTEYKEQLKHLNTDYTGQLQEILLTVPNWLEPRVPTGTSEDDNELIYWHPGDFKPEIGPERNHFELGLIDFEAAGKISGARFAVLRGQVARLERAIGQFMLDSHVDAGYTEVSVPLLVNSEALVGTGQLPKFKEDLYSVGDKWLIPTAEVPLTNLLRDTLEETPQVYQFTALTPCFRSEAGAAGRDMRGLIRQHQFNKVELVSIFPEDQADIQFKAVQARARFILEALKLPYQIKLLCSGDTGFSARQTYDFEVWLPGQQAFREISSVSYCGDFQARRMNARYRDGKEIRFYHTVNGSGLAVGRTLVAILENYQEANCIRIPDVLIPYMRTDRIDLAV